MLRLTRPSVIQIAPMAQLRKRIASMMYVTWDGMMVLGEYPTLTTYQCWLHETKGHTLHHSHCKDVKHVLCAMRVRGRAYHGAQDEDPRRYFAPKPH